jgi:aspartate 1-decarboxylase
MLREMLQGKLHRAVVTDCHIDYPGSLTVDIELIERAGMLVHQKVQIAGERGKRDIIVNGAAARHACKGDRVIVAAYGLYNEAELVGHHPRVLALDDRNQVVAEH